MKITVDDILNLPFLSRTYDDRLKIIVEGKPRPILNMASAVTMNNLKPDDANDDNELRTYQFNPSMYDEIQWLTGCDKRNTFFCWPCLLFLPSVGLWNTTGISDIVYFLEGKMQHEETSEHTQSSLKLKELIEQSTKNLNMDVDDHNEIVKRNRAILKRMLDVVCNLLTKEEPHYARNRSCELSPENCIKNLKFLRAYDVLNCNYIEDAIDLIQITPNIVNDLVCTIAKGIKMAIRKEIQQSTYVSMILSDHSKIAKKSQISTVLRYLKDGKVCERFVGFFNAGDDKSLPVITKHISRVLQEFALSERFLAVSIDGGVLQTDDVAELANTMKTEYPFTFFAPWYGHGLDHVLQQSLANMKECSAFFKAMNELRVYFHKKSKRFKSFEDYMIGCFRKTKNKKLLLKSQFIQEVAVNRKYILNFFDTILQSSTVWEPDDISKTLGFQHILQDFHNVFLLHTFTTLFSYTANMNKLLKSASPESICVNKDAESLTANLINLRDHQFDQVWSQVAGGEDTALAGPASKKIKLEDSKYSEFRELYVSIINRMIREIEIRYSNLHRLSFCLLLNSDKPGKFMFSTDLLQTLMVAHGAYFDEEQIRNELIVLRTNGAVFANKSVYDIMEFFIEAKLKSAFKYLYKLTEFILTLPFKPPSEDQTSIKSRDMRDWSYIPEEPVVRSGDISIPCVELEYLQDLKKSDAFHDELTVIFYDLNKTFELLPR